MTTYYDTIPIYVQHNDLQWDISELVNNHYPIQNDNWEISDLRVLFLKENSSFDHDYDPWNRKMRSWQYLDVDGYIIQCDDGQHRCHEQNICLIMKLDTLQFRKSSSFI